MPPHAHHAAGLARKARVHVITVSTSRGAAEDRSGPVIRDLLVREGHVIQGYCYVPDDRRLIQERLDALLGTPEVEAIISTGGTGISARDCTVEVVRSRFDRELPGFGELFRAASFEQVGSAAFLSSAVAGIAQGRIIFAIPGSPKACQLAMEALILPQLGHILYELEKERQEPATAPVSAEPPPPPPERRPPDETGRTQTLVEFVLDACGATVAYGETAEIPEGLSRIAGAAEVLRSAGERIAVRFQDGSRGAAFAFPNISRRDARVLVARNGEPVGEVIALHRGVRGVGLCRAGSPSLILPSADERLAKVTKERTGTVYEGPGRLFAVGAHEVLFVDPDGLVYQWDGRTRSPVGSVAQAATSLLTTWSQR